MDYVGIVIPIIGDLGVLQEVLWQIPQTLVRKKVCVILPKIDIALLNSEIINKYGDNLCILRGCTTPEMTIHKGFAMLSQRGDVGCVIKLNGDGSHDPNFLTQMAKRLLYQNWDVVLCSRFHPLDLNAKLVMDSLNQSFIDCISASTGCKVSDARSGYVGFKIEHVNKAANKMVLSQDGLLMELLLRISTYKAHADIYEFIHPDIYNPAGFSKSVGKHDQSKELTENFNFERFRKSLRQLLRELNIPADCACNFL